MTGPIFWKMCGLRDAWKGRKGGASPRTSIARLGMVTTFIIIFVPPIIYAVLSVQQLRQRASEQAAVGARHIEVQLTNATLVDRLNQASITVLHATLGGNSPVAATWVTDERGALLMFQGASAWWPELWAHARIRAADFQGQFNIAVSSREVFVHTLWVSLSFLLLGVAAHYSFRWLPLAALDEALQQLNHNQRVLETQKRELEVQNLRFDTALDNMVQGLAMFDAEHRLILCNRRYAEVYGLPSDQVRPGTTIRQLLEYRHALGVFGTVDFENFVGDWLREFSSASERIQEFSDGRVLSIVRRPMPNGGLVSTTEDITEQRRSEDKIAHMALHDALTGLANRSLLNERLEHALARAKRGEIVATHMLDLDHFKQVNDTLGHGAGDKLLCMVADRLRAQVRDSDTIARMGGDEFAIMQVEITQPSDAISFANRVIESVSAPYDIDGRQVVIGTSIGIALAPTDGATPDEIMRNADLALYRAKGDGRATYRFFELEMDTQMQTRRALEGDLRSALLANEFELHYQPIVDLASNDISGFEALIRWRHPEKGFISPGAFIPLAEEIGLIVPLGEWIIREACATAAKWPGDLRIAVNLSPAQFRSAGLLQVIIGALAVSGLAPSRLELEITETILLHDNEATLDTLYRLRELGVRIAMDDFGTGYSSLSYLQAFPFDKIKIDRSFVKDIANSTGSLNIVRAVAALAQGLGIATTAEGVETEEQLSTIRSEGCTEMQGYLFSRPVAADAIEALLADKGKGAKDPVAA
jgi:diguanylate cyclase (GGDEF)-like protein